MTYYPAPVVLANLWLNAQKAIPGHLKTRYCIEAHEWGDLTTALAADRAHHFTRIIAADCYWMPYQHENLVRSMMHLLAVEPSGRIFVTSGFHTGRAKLANFFDVAAVEGLQVEEIYEEDAEGTRRDWMKERDGGMEDHTERKRWLVIARLKRRGA